MKRLMLIYAIKLKAHIFIDLDGDITYLDAMGQIKAGTRYSLVQMRDTDRFINLFNMEIGSEITIQRQLLVLLWKSPKLPTIPDLVSII